jgi:hypothetical protein
MRTTACWDIWSISERDSCGIKTIVLRRGPHGDKCVLTGKSRQIAPTTSSPGRYSRWEYTTREPGLKIVFVPQGGPPKKLLPGFGTPRQARTLCRFHSGATSSSLSGQDFRPGLPGCTTSPRQPRRYQSADRETGPPPSGQPSGVRRSQQLRQLPDINGGQYGWRGQWPT